MEVLTTTVIFARVKWCVRVKDKPHTAAELPPLSDWTLEDTEARAMSMPSSLYVSDERPVGSVAAAADCLVLGCHRRCDQAWCCEWVQRTCLNVARPVVGLLLKTVPSSFLGASDETWTIVVPLDQQCTDTDLSND